MPAILRDDAAYERGPGHRYVCSCGLSSPQYATSAESQAWADGHEAILGPECGKPKVPTTSEQDAAWGYFCMAELVATGIRPRFTRG